MLNWIMGDTQKTEAEWNKSLLKEGYIRRRREREKQEAKVALSLHAIGKGKEEEEEERVANRKF